MVSARPSPNPAKGRVAYPSADTYVPGDVDNSPTYLEPVRKVTSRDSDKDRAQGLKTWWKGFRDRETKPVSNRGVFGELLSESIEYASVQISTAGPDGRLYVWGTIPVVVAKCGLYLKEHATEVEGTFRISGSAKRMRDLQTVFDTGPKYGKNIDWKSLPYSPHDVATIFRRFLTQMPEPIIPVQLYDEFREAVADDTFAAIKRYKELIRAMPPVNQYLLLYVLDLLSVFARKSDKNLMTAPNLALIFQPGVLSHPSHSMRPREHVLSQQVLEFLIEHQDHFLVGMQLKKRRKRKEKARSPTPPQSPPAVKADIDLMLPSDSDDEAPEGGYYVVEGTPLPTSPSLPPTSALPSFETSLLPSPPKARRPSAMPITHGMTDTMEPSDSDEEAPPGGYMVRSTNPAEGRAALLARSKTRAGSKGDSASILTGSTLGRRKTLPAKRVGNAPRARRETREAP